MGRICRFLAALLALSGLWLMGAGLTREGESLPAERMRNVHLVLPGATAAVFAPEPPGEAGAAESPAALELGALSLPGIESGSSIVIAPARTPETEEAVETTIEGGMRIKNSTRYYVDPAELLAGPVDISLPADDAQILIIHTHASEAYTQAGLDRYVPSDSHRTEDTQFNVVRIGDELTQILTGYGLKVIHDRGIYDYPSYTGSYSRSAAAVQAYLESCPGIGIVLDIHRDAIGSSDVVYKTMAEEEGVCASQIMLLCGSDESGLKHPDWQKNLALAVYLQSRVVQTNPTLMRPVSLVPERYNQHLSPGMLILEVGSSGNTLQEALAAVRLFGHAAAPALLELVETEEN